MKKVLIATNIACLLCLIQYTYAEDTIAVQDEEIHTQIVEDDDEVIIQMDKIIKEEPADTTHLKIGDKKVEVLKKEDETQLNIKKNDNDDEDDENEDNDWWKGDHGKKSGKFKGHLTGIDIGINNLVDKNFSITRAASEEYMDLNTSRSWNFNINFFKSSFGIVKDRFGVVTGLGFEFSNYHFDGDNNIQEVDGVIVEKPYAPIAPIKSKLSTTFLTLPVLLEAQILSGKRKERIYLSAGVIGGLKLGSNTKVVYKLDGKKKKEKDKDDFNINALRYGLTARVGYKMIDIYANYYLMPLFTKDAGPELYPFAIGLSFFL